MTQIVDTAKTVYAAGPSSNPDNPNKGEIVGLFGVVDAALTSLIQGLVIGGAVVYSTQAALYADLAHGAGKLGVVYNDSTPAYNGVYVKSGSSGSGSWSLTTLALPSTVVAEVATKADQEDLDAVAAEVATKAAQADIVTLTETVGTKASTSALNDVAEDLDLVSDTASGLEASYGGSKADRTAVPTEGYRRSGYSAVNYGANGRILEAMRDQDEIKIFGANGLATKHKEARDFPPLAFARSMFTQAEIGEQRRVSAGRDREGGIYLGGKKIATTDDYVVYTATVAGKSHVFSETRNGRRLKLSAGAFDNTGPVINGDYCMWASDRGAGATLYYSPLSKAAEARVIPLQQIACWGDSLTAHNYALGMRGTLGIPVWNFGLVGQTSSGVLSRMRATPMVVADNQIPASGVVNVSCLDGLGPVAYYGGGDGSVVGALNSIPGTLAWSTSTHQMTFTRTASGSIVATSPGSTFTWSPKDTVLGTAVTDPVSEMMHIIYFGRNNESDVDRIFLDFKSAVRTQVTLLKRFLVVPYLPAQDEPSGGSAHNRRDRLLALCKAEWPENTFDILPAFLSNGDGSPADNAAIAKRVPPPSLMGDNVHPNAGGVAVEANAFSAEFTSRNWIY